MVSAMGEAAGERSYKVDGERGGREEPKGSETEPREKKRTSVGNPRSRSAGRGACATGRYVQGLRR